MGIKKTTGFTIIEVMLFLAITGLLTVALLVGSGVAIGQQRYRDSVNSLKSLIQSQYSDVLNPANARAADSSCSTDATVVAPPETVTSPQSRGTSDCVVLGRFLTIDDTGTIVTTQNVIGSRTSTNAPTEDTDLAELATNYRLGRSPLGRTTSEIAWGARVVDADTKAPRPLSLLVIRSPLSGTVMTFVQNGVQASLDAMVDGGLLTRDKDICVNADAVSSTFTQNPLGIRINAYAANPSAIEIPLQSEGVCA